MTGPQRGLTTEGGADPPVSATMGTTRLAQEAVVDRRGWHGDEHGGLRRNSLVQMVVVLILFGLVVFEVVAVAATAFQVDDRARQVAVAASDAFEIDESVRDARDAAGERAAELDVTVIDVEVTDEEVVVLVQRQAPTLVAHRIGPLRERTVISGRGRSRWR